MYGSCVRGVMLYASECWASRKIDMARLERNEQAMPRKMWIYSFKPNDSTMGIMHAKLNLRLPFDVCGFGGSAMWREHHARSLPSET